MNLLIISFALFDIYCGARLLARTKAEALGGFYRSVALFIITIGFLILGMAAFNGLTNHGQNRQQEHLVKKYGELERYEQNCDHTCIKEPHSDTGGFLPHEITKRGYGSERMHKECIENDIECIHHKACCKPSQVNNSKCCDEKECGMHKGDNL